MCNMIRCYIVCLCSTIFCVVNLFAQNTTKIISQEEMLEIFKSSTNIYDSFGDAWPYLDKNNLRTNDSLIPYFLQLLDYDRYIQFRINYAISSEKEKSNNKLLTNYLHATNKEHLQDTIMKSAILQQMYEDSATIYLSNKLDTVYRKKTILMDLYTIQLHYQLKLPEAYKMVYNYWENKIPYEGVESFLLYFQDPTIWGEYIKKVDSRNNLNNSDYQHLMSEIIELMEIYDNESGFELYLHMLKCSDKWKACFEGITLEESFCNYCPFNVAIFYIYASKVNSPVINEIMDKLYVYYFDHYPTDDSPIYKMSYEKLKKISDEIIENYEEIRIAFKPYLDSLIKRDAYWREEMPYYNYAKQ